MSQSREQLASKGPQGSEYNERFAQAILSQTMNQTLRELEGLKELGWSSNAVHQHFVEQQNKAAVPAYAEEESKWFGIMFDIMREMDQRLHFVPESGRLRFLDIGCAPGGFSKYVLCQNPHAIGVGITLPFEDGGHMFLITDELSSERYVVHFADVTTYQLHPPFSDPPPSSPSSPPLPFPIASFDLVILDGHVLHTRPKVHGITRVLLFTQLFIGLQSIAEGGTLVIKLSHAADTLTVRLLFLLDTISGGKLEVVKPLTAHANRGTFYAVARGIPRGKVLDGFLDVLYQILQTEKWCYAENQVTGTQEGSNNRGAAFSTPFAQAGEEVLDGIVSTKDLEEFYIPRLVKLVEPVWKTQRDGLQRTLTRRGVRIPRSLNTTAYS